MIKILGHKIALIFKRVLFAVLGYFQRLLRFWDAIWKKENSFTLKFLKLVFLAGDLVFMPEVYESIMDLIKWKTRSLNSEELKMLRSVYRDVVPWKMVRLDTQAIFGPKQKKIAYVSHFTVNSYGVLQDHILIHEIMHIVQYLKYGSAYIPMALMAQRSTAKYNYGGIESLRTMTTDNKTLWDLNMEQQADVISDYFLLRQAKLPRWGMATQSDLQVYEKFVFDIFRQGEKGPLVPHTKP